MSSVLSGGDWAVILLYLLGVTGLGVVSRLRHRQDADEYLMAKRSMNWFVVALAVFATLFSTISFVSIPGEAYNFGLTMMAVALGQILFVPLGIWLFLRFFFAAPTFSAYEYLEKRYDRNCRRIAAVIFIMIRLFYTGGVFYAAAVIFESLAGWRPEATIVVIGLITLAYTFWGGIRAVILADVVQSAIIFLGIAAILFRLFQVTGFDVGGVLSFAGEHNRLFGTFAQSDFYRLNLHDRWNFWLLILVVVQIPLQTMCCDQLVIQRLLTSRSYHQAVRSTYANYLLSIPVVVMLYGIGLFLFFYYNGGGGELPAGLPGDKVLGFFITDELPAPLPGVIIVALLAALMSTVAGAVNSLVTVCFKDLVLTAKPELAGTPCEMLYCRVLTVFGGGFAILTALMMIVVGQGVRTTLLEVIGVWSNLWPILFVAFLYGVLSQRVSARAILWTMVIGGIVNLVVPYLMYYAVPEEMRWGFWYLGVPGVLLGVALPPLLSRFWPNRKNLDGLTLRTLRPDGRSAPPAPDRPLP
ncbi:sodium:solute symporter family transporter [Victivallis vadensis]|uniref:sodium:solute symporter family transporter n=1 Tax=Victivallis vadensis TaxID=172901 RepID=UPI0025945216|nr:sodium/solute symporter [Victivallis vadensis]